MLIEENTWKIFAPYNILVSLRGLMDEVCSQIVEYIQPGKPQQNGFVERFNVSFRRELLVAYLFENLNQVREMAWFWRLDYNEERIHESLGNLPTVYRAKLESSNLNQSQLVLSDSNNGTQSNLTVAYVPEAAVRIFVIKRQKST